MPALPSSNPAQFVQGAPACLARRSSTDQVTIFVGRFGRTSGDSHEMKQGDQEWVEIRSCSWLHEAQFIKSLLDGAGIEAFIPDEYTLGVQPLYAPALGGVRVLVRAHELSRASEFLEPRSPEDSGSD
jgi:hypothetical protein